MQYTFNMGDKNFLPYPKGFATQAIHAGQEPDHWESKCVVPPIVMSTIFKQLGPNRTKSFFYGRHGNPTRNVLETCLAKLEGANYGICFSSGMGALSAVIAMFRAGDHIICADNIYGGTVQQFVETTERSGIEISFVDINDANNVFNAIKKNTKLIWLETPSNPTIDVIDIQAVSEVTKKKNILLAIDNTFLTSYLQKPLQFGADLTVYSLTKYMNGHSDVIMGAIMTNSEKLHEHLLSLQISMGAIPSPFDCSMVNRSIKTLALRMRQHSNNGLAVAQYLEKHPKVHKVLHPGLPTHPHYELTRKQTCGHSGMVSFYLKGGLEESMKFMSSVKIFTFAESLGGIESLVQIPSQRTHNTISEEERQKRRINDSFIRMSVGLEDIEDLIADLEQALNAI